MKAFVRIVVDRDEQVRVRAKRASAVLLSEEVSCEREYKLIQPFSDCVQR